MAALKPPRLRAQRVTGLALAALLRLSGAAAPTTPAALPAPSAPALTLSVYATATDVLQHLAPPTVRTAALARLQALHVSRVFLEGRRGDEYVPPATLAEVRDFLAAHGLASAGGVATVPGAGFGVRQNEGLGWLNWEAEKTRRDVARFFTENAAVFDTLIVDDFFCTGDTSPVSEAARGARSWAAYRRDLLVSLIEPLMLGPARAQRPDVRLILKFPQWYDRFHLFGYDPERMAGPFDPVWVGTEVRNPHTRRMGYVQPTEGYVNFRWLRALGGEKTTGAWFDHIECTAENFTDQAFQSVLAGARELTLRAVCRTLLPRGSVWSAAAGGRFFVPATAPFDPQRHPPSNFSFRPSTFDLGRGYEPRAPVRRARRATRRVPAPVLETWRVPSAGRVGCPVG